MDKPDCVAIANICDPLSKFTKKSKTKKYAGLRDQIASIAPYLRVRSDEVKQRKVVTLIDIARGTCITRQGGTRVHATECIHKDYARRMHDGSGDVLCGHAWARCWVPSSSSSSSHTESKSITKTKKAKLDSKQVATIVDVIQNTGGLGYMINSPTTIDSVGKPNTKTKMVVAYRLGDLEYTDIVIEAVRDIRAGEELTIRYHNLEESRKFQLI